ncbi:MAG TPA: hypothetical protein VFQ44_24190 [Streptosporangiaceae bacterium]|nr:hypothetical protein [Streptosporangiaceae bacterium]
MPVRTVASGDELSADLEPKWSRGRSPWAVYLDFLMAAVSDVDWPVDGPRLASAGPSMAQGRALMHKGSSRSRNVAA